jgi:hypothetical protein
VIEFHPKSADRVVLEMTKSRFLPRDRTYPAEDEALERARKIIESGGTVARITGLTTSTYRERNLDRHSLVGPSESRAARRATIAPDVTWPAPSTRAFQPQ